MQGLGPNHGQIDHRLAHDGVTVAGGGAAFWYDLSDVTVYAVGTNNLAAFVHSMCQVNDPITNAA